MTYLFKHSGLDFNHQYSYFKLPSRTAALMVFKFEQTAFNFVSNMLDRSLLAESLGCCPRFLCQSLGG